MNDMHIDDVYMKISEASLFGNLGLFVGSGFSKEVLKRSLFDALSWDELLKKCCENLEVFEVNESNFGSKNISYPELASKICTEYAKKKGMDFYQASIELKKEIAKITGWYPKEERRKKYFDYLNSMDLNWIITTNYDLVLETVFAGKGQMLTPKDQLIKQRETVPIYHLHGVRIDPSSIIITQQDFVSLFRPNDYRQFKLPLLIKESTVLLVGYGLGDINVLTALDWSKNVFNGKGTYDYPHDIIQVLHTKDSSNKVYRSSNDIIIVETNDTEAFFDGLVGKLKTKKDEYKLKLEEIDKIRQKYFIPNKDKIDMFIDDENYRNEAIDKLKCNEKYLTKDFLYFLDMVFAAEWEKSRADSAFYVYDNWLKVILDILESFDVEKMEEALFNLLASSFEDVSQYIGIHLGESFAAKATWDGRKRKIPSKTIEKLKKYFEQKCWLDKPKNLLEF